MIGQEFNLKTFEQWIERGTIPRFMIICGEKYSGRYTLVKAFKSMMGCYLIECPITIDSVRETIENCYKCNGVTIYLFRDADRMSVNAKNALLKITENPPRQAYFILTVTDIHQVLPTLRSRGTPIWIAPYTQGEIRRIDSVPDDALCKIATSPGAYLELKKLGPGFIEFCNNIIDYVTEVSVANAFKIAKHLRLKDGEEGFDPDLVLATVLHLLCDRIRSEIDARKYEKMLFATDRCRHELALSGVKKDSTIDMWIMELRGVIQSVV